MKRKGKYGLAGMLAIGVFAMMPFNVFEAKGDVAIDETTFPDEYFRQYVSEVCDTNGDGVLSTTEIAAVKEINLNHGDLGPGSYMPVGWGEGKVKDLQGVGVFTSLEELGCIGNQLTSLDLSNNKSLWYLDCSSNPITALDISSNTALTRLECTGAQIDSLDLSNNTALELLNCNVCQLTTLDLSKNTSLQSFYCCNNQLTTLDLRKNTILEYVECGDNKLTALKVKGLKN